jgi:hypothetical protein
VQAFLPLLVLAIAGCTFDSPLAPSSLEPPADISMSPDWWTFRFSPGLPLHPVSGDGGWYFDFPVYDVVPTTACSATGCPAVHYLTTPTTRDLTGTTLTMTGRIDVTGGPTFQAALSPDNVCVNPARVRLFLERANEPTADPVEFYRWWSDVSLILAPGAGGLSARISPEHWSSVFGTKGNASPEAMAGFEATLADLATVGMTFGGGCFAGHGVNINRGAARFTVTSFVAQ